MNEGHILQHCALVFSSLLTCAHSLKRADESVSHTVTRPLLKKSVFVLFVGYFFYALLLKLFHSFFC